MTVWCRGQVCICLVFNHRKDVEHEKLGIWRSSHLETDKSLRAKLGLVSQRDGRKSSASLYTGLSDALPGHVEALPVAPLRPHYRSESQPLNLTW